MAALAHTFHGRARLARCEPGWCPDGCRLGADCSAKVPRRSPQQKSPGDVRLGQVRLQFQGAPAMKLGLLQPLACGIELKMVIVTRYFQVKAWEHWGR